MGKPDLTRPATRLTRLKMTHFEPWPVWPTNLIDLTRPACFATSTPKWNKTIMEEVEKLLTLGFIREVYYLEWIANVVMVKKYNEKWRCVWTSQT